MNQVNYRIESRQFFMDMLKKNPGYIVIKLGADWCMPCKHIHNHVHEFFSLCPQDNVICFDLNVDECGDVYSFLKSKKMVNGIPAILVYEKGNESFIPDDMHIGGDVNAFSVFASAMLVKFLK